jgi:hypothetical protein
LADKRDAGVRSVIGRERAVGTRKKTVSPLKCRKIYSTPLGPLAGRPDM